MTTTYADANAQSCDLIFIPSLQTVYSPQYSSIINDVTICVSVSCSQNYLKENIKKIL